MIGINLDKVTDYRAAQMTAVAGDYFTVWAPTRKIAYHFPFACVLSVAESIGGAGFKYDRTNVSLTHTDTGGKVARSGVARAAWSRRTL